MARQFPEPPVLVAARQNHPRTALLGRLELKIADPGAGEALGAGFFVIEHRLSGQEPMPWSPSPLLPAPLPEPGSCTPISPPTMPAADLCLLVLDSGGVRGLSSLMILCRLMAAVDPDTTPTLATAST